uniref:N-acetyltransferase domain-containing protein n=1 Tax=Euplotes harpa TaxID=151035 RepID=A0A7S3JKW2_9SPIT|mmetsp:Transcript_7079/g.8030  ORF Transcript_7079/g.8030 Transcript_7079/m.8030 type:complete len:162 (+) Transcript_7079:93-578(+)
MSAAVTGSEECTFRKATKDDIDSVIEFMNKEEYAQDCGIKLDSLQYVVSTTIEQQNFGFFLIAESQASAESTAKTIKGVAMVSFEFTDWRNGIFYWIQFAQGETQEIFDALLKTIKTLSEEDEECKGIRAVYDNKYSEHWHKINEQLSLAESHYYLYHFDA